MMSDQDRKIKVLKFSDVLRAASVASVIVSYYGDGDEGRAEPPQFHDSDGSPIESLRVPENATNTLGDLLEGFAPEGYEDGEGGHGTVTLDVQTGKILVEHNWYELVSNPADPREI